tara:strand:- start:717 stop:1604 length:888 start_codon:yes stop_codon:yes gene_type:complete
MGYNRVMLERDKYKEEYEEENAYAEFLKDVGEWGADFKLANLGGGIGGAALSFLTPFNPAVGYLVGSTLGTLSYFSKHKDDDIMNMEDFDEVLGEYRPELKSKFDSGYEGEIDIAVSEMQPTWADPFNMIFENVVNYVKMGGDFNLLDKGTTFDPKQGFVKSDTVVAGDSMWSKIGEKLGLTGPVDGEIGTFANASGIEESAMFSVDETTGVGEWIFESGEPVASVLKPEGMQTYNMADANLVDGMSFDWERYQEGLSAPFSDQLKGYQDTFNEWLETQDPDYQDIIANSKWYNQ